VSTQQQCCQSIGLIGLPTEHTAHTETFQQIHFLIRKCLRENEQHIRIELLVAGKMLSVPVVHCETKYYVNRAS